MHPTRTTTKLLLGVACAVSAVSGCVNVSPAPGRPGAAAPSAGLPPHHEPRGGPGTAPVIIQAPALEALEAAPEQSARPAGPAPAGRSAERTAERTAQGASGGPLEAAPPVPDIPEPRRPAEPVAGRQEGGRGRPHGPRPGAAVERELVRELPVRPADVCALGRRHGRWHPDSPEARICAGLHGD
ncbi:hypothetical protein [Streptomyces sp. NPDC006463]|uniref:hypothetical protein n=1 Tax=Streptomyces sp. NPDC006463 TaxID=3364746 RepID=UPI00367FCC90